MRTDKVVETLKKIGNQIKWMKGRVAKPEKREEIREEERADPNIESRKRLEDILDFVAVWIGTRFGYNIDDKKSIVGAQDRGVKVVHRHYFLSGWLKDRPRYVDISITFTVNGAVELDFSPLLTTELRRTIWRSRGFEWWVGTMARNKWKIAPKDSKVETYKDILYLSQPKNLCRDILDRMIDDIWDKMEKTEEIILEGLIKEEVVDATVMSQELSK